MLSECGECLLVLCDVANLFEFVLLLRVFLFKELPLQLLYMPLHIFQHPPDVELVIRQVVNEHSLVTASCCLTSAVLVILCLFLVLAVTLNIDILRFHLIFILAFTTLIIVKKLIFVFFAWFLC
jgi:hypothetical protein